MAVACPHYAAAMRAPWLLVVLLLLTACERDPKVQPGLLIGEGGRILKADPAGFKNEREVGAAKAAVEGLGKHWGLAVTIAEDPRPSEDRTGWYWSDMTVHLEVVGDGEQEHPPVPVGVLANRVEEHLAEWVRTGDPHVTVTLFDGRED